MDYYESPRWTAELLDCSMPMTFDTYSVCAYNCLYCFAYYQRAISMRDNYIQRKVRWVNPEKIKRMFLEPDTSQFGHYIKARKTMQWGGLSDQFDEYERQYGITLELLRFFREIGYPLSFSTKATWFVNDPRYTDVIRGAKNWHFKVSIITWNEDKAARMERGVPTPQERMKAIERLASLGIGGVTLRLRPFIIGFTDPWHKELIKRAADAGADSVSTEFLCVESRAHEGLKARYAKISELVGYDLLETYRKHTQGSGYLRLNRRIKKPFVEEMAEVAQEKGLRFYVSDAHFKEMCANGSCCGLSEGWNYSRGQYTHALVIARKNGRVRWKDIEPQAREVFGDLRIVDASGFNTCNIKVRNSILDWTIVDYMRYYWNYPRSAKSPYRYFGGVLVPKEKDENGDLVYEYAGDYRPEGDVRACANCLH